jgi:N-acetylglutamate synthase-like GNAT family acetyltransferase
MIRRCTDADFEAIYEIINDAAGAYKGVIPDDVWTEPYMSREELTREIADGVVFWGSEEGGELVGVMGIQQVGDVTLIRHSYVRGVKQHQGIGGRLLSHLRGLTQGPVLVGTWTDATWAVRFYERHGFRLVSRTEKDHLLRRYWSVPERQIETSVVLADDRWHAGRAAQSMPSE